MASANDILHHTAHRPWPMPQGAWRFYQEWRRAVFFHWAVPYTALQPLVPPGFKIDLFDGRAYVSLVAFDMLKLGPRYVPAIPAISNFHEVNLRTYINNDGKTGVYFLRMEADKHASVAIANIIAGLPYEYADMHRNDGSFRSANKSKQLLLDTGFSIGNLIVNKSTLDEWLTERYCLYFAHNGHNYRYDIHHKEWPLNTMTTSRLVTQYKVGDFDLSARPPDAMHYSHGVQVATWPRVRI